MTGAVSTFKFRDLNSLHRLGLSAGEYYVAGADNALRIRWFTADELASSEAGAGLTWARLELSLATGFRFRLYLQEGLFHTLLQGIEPAQFWQLDSLLRCAWIQVKSHAGLDWIGKHWQCAVRVESVNLLDGAPDYSHAAAFALSTAAGLNYQPGVLEAFDAEERYPLSVLFDAIPSRKGVIRANVPLCLDIIAGRTHISLAELRNLQRNDVIILETGEFSPATAELYLQGQLLFLADIEQDLLRVKQLLRSNLMADTDAPPAGADEQGSEQHPDVSTPEKSEQRIDPNEVDVVLEFSLGTLTRSLAEIEDIDEGHVFELPGQPADCVDINVNGKRLAKGEPVMIEDRIGVRIVKIEYG